MSGNAGSTKIYSFGNILLANLADQNVQTGVTDWGAAASDMLNSFSDGTLGALGKTVGNGGLPAGEQLIGANAKLLDGVIGEGSGEHAAAQSGSAFDGWETATNVMGGLLSAPLQPL